MSSCYDDIMRTIIDLPDDQRRELDAYCARKQVSRAEAVRRAVGQLLCDEEKSRQEWLAAVEAVRGIWKDRGVDTDTYLAELRSEWDREWDSD